MSSPSFPSQPSKVAPGPSFPSQPSKVAPGPSFPAPSFPSQPSKVIPGPSFPAPSFPSQPSKVIPGTISPLPMTIFSTSYIKDIQLSSGGENLNIEEAELKALKEAYFQELARRRYEYIPHVVAVNGSKITMTKIEGISLIKYIINGGYKYRDNLLTALALIISQIHDSGIIHADYGPHNIIINDNILYLIDFGESVMLCQNIDEMKMDDFNNMVTSINNIIAYMYLGGIQVSPEDRNVLQSMEPLIVNEIQLSKNSEIWARTKRYIEKYM